MKLRTLGGLGVDGHRDVRPRPLLVAAFLAMEGPHERGYVADLFFGGSRDPRASLRVMLSRTRTTAPGLLETDGSWLTCGITCDASRLLTRLDQGEPGTLVAPAPEPFLAGVERTAPTSEVEEWILGTREFIADRLRSVALDHAERLFELGDPEGARRWAERALDVPSAPPASPEQLLLAYPLLPTNSPARDRVRGELSEFGLEPPERRRLVPGRHSAGGGNVVAGLGLSTGSSAILVGRRTESDTIARWLESGRERLVTMHGVAGVGKTRLARHVAQELAREGRFGGSVHWVALESTTDPSEIAGRIAAAWGLALKPTAEPVPQLARAVGDEPRLLVLDNFEQLAEAAPLVASLVEACPALSVLVTSRERLRVRGERVAVLRGLPYPEPGAAGPEEAARADAVHLFVLRAQNADPDFRLDDATVDDVLRICRRVAGAPLGLELAAAWVRALPLTEIAAELDAGLDRLEALDRDASDAHRTLEAALQRSWSLLDDGERSALRRLSVFRGGFRRDGASYVVGATLPLLADLLDKSLLQMRADGRYVFHPLVERFASDRAAEWPDERRAAERRHGAYVRTLLPRLLRDVDADVGPLALSRLFDEIPNYDAAWARFLADDDLASMADVVHLRGMISEVWGRFRDDHADLERTAERLIGDDPERRLLRGRLLGVLGMAYWRLGRFDDGARAGLDALDLLARLETRGQRLGTWYAGNAAGMNLYVMGRFGEAARAYRIAYDVTRVDARLAEDTYWRRRFDGMAGLSAGPLGIVELLSGRLRRAGRWVTISCGRMHRSRPRIAAYADAFQGMVETAQGRFAEAERVTRAGLRHAESVGHAVQRPALEAILALAVFHQHRYDEALAIALQGQRRAEAAGDRMHAARNRAVAGRALVRLHRLREAREILARAIQDAAAIRIVPWALDDALLGAAEVAVARGEDHLARAVARRVVEFEVAHPWARREATDMLGRLPVEPGVTSALGDAVVARALEELGRETPYG